MYIKTIHFGGTWHNFNPLIATWQFNTPVNIDLSGNIHLNLELITAIFPLFFNQALIFLSQLTIKFKVSIMNTTFPLYLILQIKNPKYKSISLLAISL
ncbi:hypothetical protein HanRHA438_Chr09g0398481 [Helianthus annuus]|uniref:Uncharacterized protein n=1 Tax=Helianthus annuus TaxID=4232 RepID=A0A251TV43_HELAN|nr:hypothetical protein HanXRQr2_Chr09g0386841 [Helianthus annuus]KAJ0525937.1 hypothetical protein HanHA300_Chr09g0317631 [Helianthus annuus]KAJ0542333.1 hypothetical protein HanHA89_Chr09g0338611 [Helianthus annuus]KAJ0629425.1 hypothetical protein HanIR_Chr00c11g0907881 [Helianthus annuus]KAJ0707375.1 hypothetical protein HanLR1_Chr09g0317751 [Helianthus annuus]